MGPGRSPSRLRSKTSDFSDLIRGNQKSSEALVPPLPPVLATDTTTPTKNKRTLAGLLGRKRKSGGFALDSNHRDEDESYPAVPEALLKSRIPAPSSLPSSLPPLNVSPPSFGTPFPPSASPVTGRFSTATHESAASNPSKTPSTDSEKPAASSSKGGPLRILRPQKSISFEVSRPFDFTHKATATNMEMLNSGDGKAKAKPVITVSAPANDMDHSADSYNAPRAAPAPPSNKSRGSKFGFGHSSKKDEPSRRERRNSATPAKDKSRDAASASSDDLSRTPTLSPMLPEKMEFPLPPSSKSVLPRATGHSVPPLAEPFEHSAKAPVARAYRSATTSDASDGELTQASSRSAPVRPMRPASLIIPPAARPRSNSSQTVKVPSSPSSPSCSGKPSASPSRLRSIRSGQSSTPASPPPATPLPSPPTSATFPHGSDAEGWSTDASTRLGGWSTDTSTRIGSLASRKSMQSVSRVRAHTIVGSISKPPSIVSSGLSSGGEESERTRMRYMRPNASAIHLDQPRSAHSSGSRTPRETAHDSGVEEGSMRIPSRPPSGGSHRSQETTPTRDDTQSQALRHAHDTYVRVLQEKHAAEKAELLRRIDRLEREARKRDREIKGLRWLILNANSQKGGEASTSMLTLDDELKMGRLRSGSKSSEISAVSSASRSLASSGLRHLADSATVSHDSPRESTEDGVLEVQEQISDLIAPWQTYTPRIEPAEGERSGSPSSISSLRRSNTMPDREAQASKHAKRTSSPVLPASGGLGFDMPSMPGSSSDMSMTDVVSSTSIPSLTASASASSQSSALSAIPELGTTPSSESTPDEKRERRTSRALKRMSASSIMQAAQTYASNLKIGMSPSIGQVLERSRTAEEAGMDDVLRKLRTFGGEQHH